jgi:hypothetical protein
LLVGSFEPFDEAEAVRVGANGHLTKPFQSIKQLVEQVRELIAPADHPVAFEETIPLNVEATPESGPADELLETQPLEPSAASEETDEPDTSDIDSLYLQSLENTAEMETPPMMADGGSLGDVSSDDSLIDTVPAGGEPTEFVPEELPAEFEANGLSRTLNDSPAISREVTDPNASDHVSVSPFEITLSDGAPVAESQLTSTDVADLPQFEDTIRNETPIPPFTTGDILDIPGTSSASSPFAPEQPVSNGGSSTTSVVNVSPELIDLIVQKVIERLEEKQDRGSDPAFS